MFNVQTKQQIAEFLLKDHSLAFVVTNRNLQIIECGGERKLFPESGLNYYGLSLYDLSPELIGAEAELAALLCGESPLFKLPLVNRIRNTDQVYYVDLINLPYTDQHGKIQGILHLIEDCSERGRLEQTLVQHRNDLSLLSDQIAARNLELAAANAELKQMDEVKSRFISVAAHELRNPLASIMGYLELLRDDSDVTYTADQQQCLDVIERSSQRLLAITNNLLDITRIESGRIELDLQRVNLLTLVEHVATDLQPLVSAKRQVLFLDAAPELPMALCDELRSTQILSNLLSNAIKYTPERGRLTIRIAHSPHEKVLVLSVSDTGIGITPSDQDKIFHTLFRASNVHDSGESGTGLGLSITKSLVELQNGRIWFESQLNKGSTFYVTFPIDEG